MKLSKNKIESFAGKILPLHLGFDSKDHATLAKADIKWSSSSDAVTVKGFSGEDPQSFNNGVLLILNKAGEATVTAQYNGETYTAAVSVRERIKADSEDKFEYFVGDMHDHTSHIHNHEKFINRTSEFQSDFINCIKQDGKLDFCVMSDHGIVLNDTDFFRNFVEVEKAGLTDTVIFPGSESEISIKEEDRFGILHKNSGEIVTVNTYGYTDAYSWADYHDIVKDAPEPICVFAHPLIVGYSVKGVWNFSFAKNATPVMLDAIRGIEMGDGIYHYENLIHELAYSDALDAGFSVSTTCSSDCHGPVWGYDIFPGKTVLLAKEKSYEAFLDAFRANRFYACESGNIKLSYTVNSNKAPCTLPAANKYRFHVELSYFKDDPTTVPINCKVVSDYGETLMTVNDVDFSSFDFEIESDTARYFYLRFIDSENRRTWSFPVWTGRAADVYKEPDITPIDLSRAKATDIISGMDASSAIDGDVHNLFAASSKKASIVIELEDKKTVSAVGQYPRIVTRIKGDTTWESTDFTASMATRYAVYASEDGLKYKMCAKGTFRILGGENIVTFEPTLARFIRIDILSNVGNDTIPKIFGHAKTVIANLSLYE